MGISRAALRLLVLLAVWCPLIAAQTPSQHTDEQGADAPAEESEFALTFSRAGGAPGTEVALPVYFTRRPGAPHVAQVRLRLSYPSSPLAFKRVEDAYLAKRAGLAIKAQEEKGSSGQTALDITFALPDPGKNFPSGQLAYLHFVIASEAQNETVTMKTELWIDGKAIPVSGPQARLEEARVIISSTPLFVGCFFFTH